MNPLRKKIYDKYNGKCSYCGCDLNGKFQIDHLIPKERFVNIIKNSANEKLAFQRPEHLRHLTESDVNHTDNLMPACCSCNNYKSVYLLEDFRNQLTLLVGRLNNTATIYKISKRYGLIQEVQKPVVFYFETVTNSQPQYSTT